MTEVYNVTIKKNSETWRNEKEERHRVGKPAYIEYYENGTIFSEYYHLNDKRHNQNGPARIYYYEDGNIESEFYFLNDELHNENGPASILYNKDGTIQSESYYLNDIILSKEEFHNKTNSCENSIVNVNGKKYKLVSV